MNSLNPNGSNGGPPYPGYNGMSQSNQQGEGSGPDLSDYLFMLSRHKWKIALLGLGGLVAAAVTYLSYGGNYQSDAKLLVRYVLERSVVDSELDSTVERGSSRSSANVIEDEIQILKSWDLAKIVADAIGPEKLIPENSSNPIRAWLKTLKSRSIPEDGTEAGKEELNKRIGAAQTISERIKIIKERDSNVISISFHHSNPDLTVPVLNELITRYFDKHLEIHRSIGAAEFVEEQTQQVKERLAEIEAELNELKKASGEYVSIGNAGPFGFGAPPSAEENGTIKESWWNGPPAVWATIRQSLMEAETEYAAQKGRIKALEENITRPNKNQPASVVGTTPARVMPDKSQIVRYETLVSQIAQLQTRNINLQAKFPPGNRIVQQIQREIEVLESERRPLVAEYPVLLAIGDKEFFQKQQVDQSVNLDAEYALLAATEARINVLKDRVNEIQKAEKILPALVSKIHNLEQIKATEEEKYIHFSASVEKARIDGMLDPSKMPNITVVQSASPAVKILDPAIKKIVLMLAGSGFALGIGLALAREMFFDRRIKRSCEFKKQLDLPLLLTIPMMRKVRGNNLAKNGKNGSSLNSDEGIVTSEDQFWPYAAAIHDRLFSGLQLDKDRKGPKLIGITGFTKESGTSTLAISVAAMSAAKGEKTLFIDMNADAKEPHSIYEAKKLLNESNGNGNSSTGPITSKELYNLLPLIQKSEYEYVIFDMPKVDPTSSTYSTAGFMDYVLLIVDATRTDREVVKQGYEDILRVNPNVSCIFNKAQFVNRDAKEVVAERRRQFSTGLARPAPAV